MLEFLNRRWPDARILRELPVSLKRNGQVVVGIADLVIESGDRLHIIDHKTYPGTRAECKRRATGYAPQIFAYRDALETATGKTRESMAVHYSIQGLVVKIEEGRL